MTPHHHTHHQKKRHIASSPAQTKKNEKQEKVGGGAGGKQHQQAKARPPTSTNQRAGHLPKQYHHKKNSVFNDHVLVHQLCRPPPHPPLLIIINFPAYIVVVSFGAPQVGTRGLRRPQHVSVVLQKSAEKSIGHRTGGVRADVCQREVSVPRTKQPVGKPLRRNKKPFHKNKNKKEQGSLCHY